MLDIILGFRGFFEDSSMLFWGMMTGFVVYLFILMNIRTLIFLLILVIFFILTSNVVHSPGGMEELMQNVFLKDLIDLSLIKSLDLISGIKLQHLARIRLNHAPLLFTYRVQGQ